MMGRLMYLALMLSLCIISASYAELKTSLSGCWKNELGSTMQIVVNGGCINGTYVSQVSKLRKPVKGVVVGYQQNLTQPTFGFVVVDYRVGMDVFHRNDAACKPTNLQSESGEVKQEVCSAGEFSESCLA